MFKRIKALHVLLAVLVVAGLAFGGVMLFQTGFAQGAVTQLPEGALEGLSALPREGFHAQRFANPAFGASPLLMGFSLFFRIIFFMMISLIVGLFRRVLWGGRWGTLSPPRLCAPRLPAPRWQRIWLVLWPGSANGGTAAGK